MATQKPGYSSFKERQLLDTITTHTMQALGNLTVSTQ
jgi:hypothetical protein